MTDLEATVEIAEILVKLWRTPHQHQTIYHLVTIVTRKLLNHNDSYERAILEYDATKVICEHYGV